MRNGEGEEERSGRGREKHTCCSVELSGQFKGDLLKGGKFGVGKMPQST